MGRAAAGALPPASKSGYIGSGTARYQIALGPGEPSLEKDGTQAASSPPHLTATHPAC